MASAQPIVKQIAWLSLIPQMMLLVVLIAIFIPVTADFAPIYGAVTFLLITLSVRILIPSEHREGISALKKMNYEKAIACFERSYAFFKKHQWIDNWRYIILLSSSRISYKEMALLNIAFCLGQLKRGSESKGMYERVLAEYPDSQMATSSLNMYAAILENTEQSVQK